MSFTGRLSVTIELTLEDSEVEVVQDALVRLLEEKGMTFLEALDYTVTAERFSG